MDELERDLEVRGRRLGAALAGSPGGAPDLPAVRGVVARRHRRRLAASALAVTAVLAGGAVVITGRGDGAGPSVVAVGDGGTERSTLQVRPVQGGAEGCGRPTSEVNPADSAPTVLAHDDGCYLLGAAAMVIDRAEASLEEAGGGTWQVDVRLEADDAERFDAVAADHLDRQLAIVMSGRVVMIATVHQADYRGHIKMSGLSEAEARQVVSGLDG